MAEVPLSYALPPSGPAELPAVRKCQELTAVAGNLYRLRVQLEARAQQQDPLAEFCLSLVPDPRDALAPFQWLAQSAKHGLPEAQLLMGTAYETGMWTDPDPQQALVWFTHAAQKDFGLAQFELAAIHFEGRLGIQPNLPESLFWATLADEHKIPEAQELRASLERALKPRQQQMVRLRLQEWHSSLSRP
ncbi:MAG: hypothetical protein NPIRA04_03370 [Nitrospirales bacterium]|nr:MAG: hypothetical protein NPIRA04_03370 [Nitrospirales bacterium]